MAITKKKKDEINEKQDRNGVAKSTPSPTPAPAPQEQKSQKLNINTYYESTHNADGSRKGSQPFSGSRFQGNIQTYGSNRGKALETGTRGEAATKQRDSHGNTMTNAEIRNKYVSADELRSNSAQNMRLPSLADFNYSDGIQPLPYVPNDMEMQPLPYVPTETESKLTNLPYVPTGNGNALNMIYGQYEPQSFDNFVQERRANAIDPFAGQSIGEPSGTFETEQSMIDKWLANDYEMTDEDKKQAKEYLRKVGYHPNKSRYEMSDEDFARLNNLDLKANWNPASEFLTGMVQGAIPGYEYLANKFGTDDRNAYIDSLMDDYKVAGTLGEFGGKAIQYGTLGKALRSIPALGKVTDTIGKGAETLLGNKINPVVANQLGRSLANASMDIIPDLAIDTVPTEIANYNKGMRGQELLDDTAKNILTNMLFNAGAEGLSYLPKFGSSAKAINAEQISRYLDDLSARGLLTNDNIGTVIDNLQNSLKGTDVSSLADGIKGIDDGAINSAVGRRLTNNAAERTLGNPLFGIDTSMNPNTIPSLEDYINPRRYGVDGNVSLPNRVEEPVNAVAETIDDAIKPALETTPEVATQVANESGISQQAQNLINQFKEMGFDDDEIYSELKQYFGKDVADTWSKKNIIPTSTNVRNASNDIAETVEEGMKKNSYYNNTVPFKTDMPESVTNELKENPQMYKQLKNADTKAKADAILNSNSFENAYNEFGKLLGERDPASIPLGYNLAKQAGINGNIELAVNIVESMSTQLSKSGQFSQAAAIEMLKENPMAALRYMEKQIQKANAGGLEKYGKKKWNILSLTDDEKKAFAQIDVGDEEAIKGLYDSITKRLASEVPSSMWEKVVEATKTSMMLNPRTHIRNVTANSVMLPIRSITDRVSALGQNIAHLINPDIEVTQSILGGTRAQKKIADKIFDEQIKPLLSNDKWEGVADNISKNKQVFSDSAVGKKLKGATLRSAEVLNGLTNGKFQNIVDGLDESMTGSIQENLRRFDYWLLGAVEDDPFVKKNFSNRLASYMKAQGISDMADVPNDAVQMAYQEALKATFKDDNYLTKMFSNIKKNTGKFGEVLLPFTKTPANLAKRGIEYSPVGFIDTLKNANGKNASEVIDDLSKNLVGTSGIALGYYLADKGFVNGALSTDKDKQAFEKQQGKQAYSINVGDNSYTIDWAQPASIPLLLGITIHDAVKESDAENESIMNYLGIGKQAGVAAFDAWADLSPLSSFKEVFGGGGYSSGSIGENIINSISDFPQRLIPAVQGATARTIDPTMRKTYSKNDPVKTFVDTAKSKIPALGDDDNWWNQNVSSKSLPATYDTWGNERTRQDSTGEAAFAQFVNPGTMSNNSSTPLDAEITRIYDATASNKVFPNVAGWSVVDGNGNKINLNNEQQSEYQREMGQTSYNLVKALINSPNYNKVSDDEKAEMLSTVYSIAKNSAENKLFGTQLSESNQKLVDAINAGSREADKVIHDIIRSGYLKTNGYPVNDATKKLYDEGNLGKIKEYVETKDALNEYGFDMGNKKAVDAYNNGTLEQFATLDSAMDSYGWNNSEENIDFYNSMGADKFKEYGDYVTANNMKNNTQTRNIYSNMGVDGLNIIKSADKDKSGTLKKDDELLPYLKSKGYTVDEVNAILPYLGWKEISEKQYNKIGK